LKYLVDCSIGETGVVNVEYNSSDPEELSFVIGILSDNHGSSIVL